ncbi:MAG TPA: PspC domain-containing protein [Sphaerochaeta sp.]|nr:PspC domain-containing protein [Sphaerochaeta sp.]
MRSQYNRYSKEPVLLGVCTALSRRTGLSLTLIRIIALLLTLRFGVLPAAITYFAAALLLPPR